MNVVVLDLGPAKEVHTHDEKHGHTVDYVAKPDYHFEYGVEDPKSQVSQFRKEYRDDDTVHGQYSYTDPDGHVRLVKYTADKLHGFQAEIFIDGKLQTHAAPTASYHTEPAEEEEPKQQQQHYQEPQQHYQEPQQHYQEPQQHQHQQIHEQEEPKQQQQNHHNHQHHQQQQHHEPQTEEQQQEEEDDDSSDYSNADYSGSEEYY